MGKQVKVTFYVDEELRRQAKVKAAQSDQSMSSVLREFLKRWVEEDPPEAEGQEEPEKKTI